MLLKHTSMGVRCLAAHWIGKLNLFEARVRVRVRVRVRIRVRVRVKVRVVARSGS